MRARKSTSNVYGLSSELESRQADRLRGSGTQALRRPFNLAELRSRQLHQHERPDLRTLSEPRQALRRECGAHLQGGSCLGRLTRLWHCLSPSVLMMDIMYASSQHTLEQLAASASIAAPSPIAG